MMVGKEGAGRQMSLDSSLLDQFLVESALYRCTLLSNTSLLAAAAH